MAESFIQPQGFAQLNPASRIARNAQAVMVGAMDTNIVTGARLQGKGEYLGGSDLGNKLTVLPTQDGLGTVYGQNVWRFAEECDLGTKSFIDFWYGYPTQTFGSSGGGGNQFTTVLGNSNGGAATGLHPHR